MSPPAGPPDCSVPDGISTPWRSYLRLRRRCCKLLHGGHTRIVGDASVRSDKPRGGITPTSSSDPMHLRCEVAVVEVVVGSMSAAAEAAAAAWAWPVAVAVAASAPGLAAAAAEVAVMITWPVKKYK